MVREGGWRLGFFVSFGVFSYEGFVGGLQGFSLLCW